MGKPHGKRCSFGKQCLLNNVILLFSLCFHMILKKHITIRIVFVIIPLVWQQKKLILNNKCESYEFKKVHICHPHSSQIQYDYNLKSPCLIPHKTFERVSLPSRIIFFTIMKYLWKDRRNVILEPKDNFLTCLKFESIFSHYGIMHPYHQYWIQRYKWWFYYLLLPSVDTSVPILQLFILYLYIPISLSLSS